MSCESNNRVLAWGLTSNISLDSFGSQCLRKQAGEEEEETTKACMYCLEPRGTLPFVAKGAGNAWAHNCCENAYR